MAEGEFALGGEHLEQASRKASLPAKWGSMPSDLDLNATLLDLAVQQRDAAKLREYAPIVEETAHQLGHRLYQAMAERARGVTYRLDHQYPEAQTHLLQALHSFETLGTRWQLGRTLVEFGELEDAQQNYAAAREYFLQALVHFEAIFAQPAAATTRLRLQKIQQ